MQIVQELYALAKEANIPVTALAEYGFGVARGTFLNWCTADESSVSPERMQQIVQIRDILKHQLERKVLPRPREEYIWAGIIHTIECVNPE